MSSKTQFLKHIEYLITKYENEEKSGIFFKLEKGKDPSEILGVLDFLKYKLEKWGNTNIFSYLGSLFGKNTILVIGSSNSEEAIVPLIELLHFRNTEIYNILIDSIVRLGKKGHIQTINEYFNTE
ncbi:unnamed protein product, partial [marine sediment metagenome]